MTMQDEEVAEKMEALDGQQFRKHPEIEMIFLEGRGVKDLVPLPEEYLKAFSVAVADGEEIMPLEKKKKKKKKTIAADIVSFHMVPVAVRPLNIGSDLETTILPLSASETPMCRMA